MQDWMKGTVGQYSYSAKVHQEPSRMGINQGRISKLDVRLGGHWVANYDRGWDIQPEGPHKAVVDQIIAQLERQR